MQHATIDYPDEVRISLNVSPEQFVTEIRLAAALKLYELGRLSSGRAAELAGVSRVRFLHLLGQYGVATFALSEDDLVEDAANAHPR